MSNEDDSVAALDSLERAMILQANASALGFDWPDVRGVIDKLHEEITEVCDALDQGDREQAQREVGDLLFSVVNLARFVGAHPTRELHSASDRFDARFSRVKETVARSGRPMSAWSLHELDAVWEAVKAAEL